VTVRASAILGLAGIVLIGSLVALRVGSASVASSTAPFSTRQAIQDCAVGQPLAYRNGVELPAVAAVRGRTFFVVFGDFSRSLICDGRLLPTGFSAGHVSQAKPITSRIGSSSLALFAHVRNGSTDFVVLSVGSKMVRIEAVGSRGLFTTTKIVGRVAGVLFPSQSRGVEVVGFDTKGLVVSALQLSL